MKKYIAMILAMSLCLALFAGCSEKTAPTTAAPTTAAPTTAPTTAAPTTAAPTTEAPTEAEETFPVEFAGDYIYSGGAGGWATQLKLNADGTFSGSFSDTELGESGEGYEFTVYVCDFTGVFDKAEQNDDGSWSVHLAQVETDKTEGEEWIEEKVRYVVSQPYGFEDGEDYIFYTPDTETEGLDESYLVWWKHFSEDEKPETLGYYSIRNTATDAGFFKY